MPALSPTMSQGNLVAWHVQEGQAVAPGDVLADVETDKATLRCAPRCVMGRTASWMQCPTVPYGGQACSRRCGDAVTWAVL